MTRFTVVWVRAARDELTSLWIDLAEQRQAITEAANTIDLELADRPFLQGAELSEGLYYIEFCPLRVFFVVNEADRIVKVVGIRRIPGTA